ncbi:hypothetical protein COU54_02700 [Candidatus Pacearchaeota archaeon CG10_big_fil_rev_8_21_14_0_10_31_24]|nr:MAG: hypothetical protein COU54_02700 [Candidatus Pacearchaeota archaeon CG10_big_fil_rev_8_21_14_0_10_31_24]
MKFKLIFGIAIPVIIIIVLAILGSSNSGFSLDQKYIDKIAVADVYYNDQLRNSVFIGNITMQNDYFLGKRHSLPILTACLIDSQDINSPLDAGTVFYSEGDMDYSPNSLTGYMNYDMGYGNYDQIVSIDLPANSEKIVKVYLNPNYAYYQDNSQLLEYYKPYEELVIMKLDSNYYSRGCYAAQKVDFENGIHIPLIIN